MVEAARFVVCPNKQVAEVLVVENTPEAGDRLFENLLSMGNEKQVSRTAAVIPLAVVAVVEGRNDCLSGSGCSDYEVSLASMHLALRLELIEDSLLE